ncbi:MAG: hypothetical protein JSU70_08705 [Phycisphaerales bacterium]|nr:MAG: hypothetical protein JSU70_08705 [Phycisphaerales bacterium]
MWKRQVSLISIALLLGSVGIGAEIFWSDGDPEHNHLWTDPDNWEGGVVPGPGDEAQILSPEADAGHGPIIQAPMDLKLAGIKNELEGRPGKPELTMTGGNLELTDFVWWGDYDNIEAFWYHKGGNVTVANEFELGWGPGTGGAGTLEMTGGTISAAELVIPTGSGAYGRFYLRGGTFTVRDVGGLEMNANGLIDITEGTLLLEGDQTTAINSLITDGQITAYDGAGYFDIDYGMRNPGKTTLTAAPITEKAYRPDPPDGAVNVTTPLLKWEPGLKALSHEVYLGTSQKLGPAEFMGPQGWPLYWHAPGLASGVTYYWRVDEVEADGTTHTGDVWRFTAAPATAYGPNPCDGAKWVDAETDLSWSIGLTAASHDVYFGTDETAVADGTGGTSKGNLRALSYDPGHLQMDTTYYWRIDEVEADGTIHTGDVWSFTVMDPSAGEGLKGEYFHFSGDSPPARSEAFRTLVLTRMDPGVDFDWGNGSPDPKIGADKFSVRWTGELEVAAPELYTFSTNSDDGVRLWLDDELIIDNWTDHGAVVNRSKPMELAAGLYFIQMEYYENGGSAVAELSWENPCMPAQIIPAGALSPPLRAFSPKPANGATGVTQTPTLRFSAGDKALQHELYFGTDEAAVAAADSTTPGIYRGLLNTTSYLPPESPLEFNQTYYWKVNEKNTDGTMSLGKAWSFTVADYIIIDDFEDYNDYSPDRIFQTWLDGFGYTEPPPGRPGNGTGSTVGYTAAPFAEQDIVYGGGQSMPLGYDNSGAGGKAHYSEAERAWAIAQDWTREGVKALTLWFYGNPANSPEQLYVVVQDAAGKIGVKSQGDASAVTVAAWQEWNIDLKEISDDDVDLTAVKKLYIGVGSRASSTIGGTGNLFIDEIRLYRPRCVASLLQPANDLSGNCAVDHADVEILAGEWLSSGGGFPADLDGDDDVDFSDYAALADTWLDELLWPAP